MAVVSFLVCDTHFHIHRVVKYIESLVISKASEQEQGETQMGGKSTRHHIVAAWRTSMSRKKPVLNFGVMCRGTTLFYFWRFRDQDNFVLQAAFNIFFLTIFGFISHFIHFFFRWDITASCCGFLHLLYIFL